MAKRKKSSGSNGMLVMVVSTVGSIVAATVARTEISATEAPASIAAGRATKPRTAAVSCRLSGLRSAP